MKKRGQAAMEFIMTYGWAILVVIIAIAALAYFGVLSPSKFLPESCILTPGIACMDHKVTTSGAQLVIRNSLGFDITIDSLDVAGCSKTGLATSLKNGEQTSISITGCSNGAQGTQFKGSIKLGYTRPDTSISKLVEGTIATKIQ